MSSFIQKFSHTIDWPAFMESQSHSVTDLRLQDFCKAKVCDPSTELQNTPFVALDFETTGLNPEEDDIVSFGLIPFTLSGIACKSAQYQIVKPQQPLDDSVLIHGITHSDISGAPDLQKIFEELLQKIAGKVVVVHCMEIERNFLHNALQKRLGEGVYFPMIDTMALEAEIIQRKETFWHKIRRKPQPSTRLSTTRRRYGLPRYQSHHALTDAMATAELFLAQISHHYTPDLPVQKLWR